MAGAPSIMMTASPSTSISIASRLASDLTPRRDPRARREPGHPAARHARRCAASAAARHARDFLRVAVCAPSISRCGRRPPAAREVRITGAAETLDEALSAVAAPERRRDRRSRRSRGPTSSGCRPATAAVDVLAKLRDAGLDAIAELPLDDRRSGARCRARWRRGASTQCADRRRPRRRAACCCCAARAAGALRRASGAQPAAVDAARVPADDRLRRREDGGDRAAGGAEHAAHPGGLAALRSRSSLRWR